MYEIINPESIAQGDFGHFGLNQGKLSKFELFIDTEKNYQALDVSITVGTSEIKSRYFESTKFFNKGEEIPVGTPEYLTAKAASEKTTSSLLCHFAKAFISQEQLEALFASGKIVDFKSFVETIEAAIKAVPNWNAKELDIFLQYQSKPNENGKTYLELPKNLKHGLFVIAKQAGDWKEDKTTTHLRYTNEKGEIHPFSRGSWFMKSSLANPVTIATEKEETPIPAADVQWETV